MPAPTLWRIRDRDTFAALRQSGRRARRGLVTVTWLPAANAAGPDEPPRVAFAVPRRTGAVARNRVRRRLRSAVAMAGPLHGSLLVSAGGDAATAPWEQLRADVAAALEAAMRPTAPAPAEPRR